MLAAGAAEAAVDFTFELPAVFAPVVIVAALLAGSALTPILLNAPPAPPAPPRRGRAGLALAAATLVAGWAMICVSGLQYLTERALDRSEAAVRAHDLDEAAGAAVDAGDLQPWSAAPRVQLGIIYRIAGDYDAARHALREAIERADEDWRPWATLALVDGFAGDVRAACRDVHEARALNPKQKLLRRPIRGLECPIAG